MYVYMCIVSLYTYTNVYICICIYIYIYSFTCIISCTCIHRCRMSTLNLALRICTWHSNVIGMSITFVLFDVAFLLKHICICVVYIYIYGVYTFVCICMHLFLKAIAKGQSHRLGVLFWKLLMSYNGICDLRISAILGSWLYLSAPEWKPKRSLYWIWFMC